MHPRAASTLTKLLALLAGLTPGLGVVLGQNPDCYLGPPVVGDCVTEQGNDWFCHLHFQMIDDTDCNYSRPVRACSRKYVCKRDPDTGQYRIRRLT